MNTAKVITKRLSAVVQRNQDQANKRKQDILARLKTNLGTGQTKEQNQHLINAYINTKPRAFNQMQQAFEQAITVTQ